MVEAVPIEHDPFEGDGSPPKPYAMPVDHTPIFDDDVRYGAPFDAASQATPQSLWRNPAQPVAWPTTSVGNQPSDNTSANGPAAQRSAASEAPEQPGALRTFATAAGQAAVGAAGDTIKGLTVAAGRLNRRALDVMDRVDRGEYVPPIDDPIGYQDMTQEQRRAFREQWKESLTRPIEENPAYKLGVAVGRYGYNTFPLTPEQRASWAGRGGNFVGGLLPAIAATGVGSLLGTPEAGWLVGASQQGMQAAGATFDDAMAHGASEDDAAKAAGLSALVGAGLGAVPLSRVLAPVRASAPGLMGWAAAKIDQALRSGVTFAGVGEAQDYLRQEIAKAYYDPNAKYSPDIERVLINLIGGGAIWTLGSTRGGAAPESRRNDQPAPNDRTLQPPPEPDAPGADQVGARPRFVIPADSPSFGKDLGRRVTADVRYPLYPFSGKDVQRAHDQGSPMVDPWLADVARRSRDDGASGVPMQDYTPAVRPIERAAGANNVRRANNSDGPPRDPGSEPGDEGDRFEAPQDPYDPKPRDHETTKNGMTPDREELLRDVTGFGPAHFRGHVIIRPNRKIIRGALLDEEGLPMGLIERTLYPFDKTLQRASFPEMGHAVHSHLELLDGYQGKDIAKDILAHSIEWYGRNGINFAHAHANIEWGAYAWGKYGFVPKAWSWPLLKLDIADRLEDFRAGGHVSDRQYKKVQAALQSDDPKALWGIVDNTSPIPSSLINDRSDWYTTLGKALLRWQRWDGKLNLGNNDMMDRFHGYVGRKR
jgi:hypothetical protein